MTKEKTYKEKENELLKGKKKYQERLVQDEEAKQEIDNFLYNPEKEDTYEGRTPIRPFD